MEKNNYDIIVVGGGTAGCACAWSAARLGLKTLLVEKNNYLGGAMTAQLVVPAMKTDSCGLNTEFYDELVKSAHEKKAQITYTDGNEGWFNPIKLPDILLEMLSGTGVDVIFDSSVLSIEKKCIETKQNDKTSKIISLCIAPKYTNNPLVAKYYDKKHSDNGIEDDFEQETQTEKIFYAKYFVDATGDGILSEITGAKFLPYEKSQALSLRFIMSNVDKKAFADRLLALDANRDVTTAAEADGELHLSTACTWDVAPNWALKPIFDRAVEDGALKDTDRAYFQVFSIAGETDKIAFNCPRIVSDKDFDPLSESDMQAAKALGTQAISRLEAFCKKYLSGFENAYVSKIADCVGVRESRRVKGLYVLSKEDIYDAKEFENTVAYSNYPIDVHSVKRDDYSLEYVQKTYAIPLESLIVKGFSNLFVIGRCLSADFYAQAAVRIQPTCFSMGEGVARHINRVLSK